MTNISFRKEPLHTWFFFGMATEDVLCPYLSRAESLGCEIMQIFATMVPVKPSGLLAANGQAVPVIVYRVLVRCKTAEFKAIQEACNKLAEEEKKENLRHGIS